MKSPIPIRLASSLATSGGARADLLVLSLFEGDDPTSLHPDELLGDLEAVVRKKALGKSHRKKLSSNKSKKKPAKQKQGLLGSSGSVLPFSPANAAAGALLGLGDRSCFEIASVAGWAVQVLEVASRQQARRLLVRAPDHEATKLPEKGATKGGAKGEDWVERCVVALARAAYRFDRFRDAEPGVLESITLLPPGKDTSDAADRAACRRGLGIAAGQGLCRDLANTPPNVATPQWMVKQARKLAREHRMTATVLLPRDLERKGMGGLLSVGGGSANPPRMLRLTSPSSAKGPRVALVGKGVTFDTGGISIKPSASMEEMKFDKCGACAVLGVVETVARLGLGLRLDAYLPLAENMPDAAAYRPSDIVRCYNGKTVEIINTDAEGRMILADAMAWAAESKPDYIVELSTLTGANVVALGLTGAALYTPEDEMAAALLCAADQCGERLWRMPLWPEFDGQMKGDHSDLKNTGDRWGGGNSAAAFLSHFVGEVKNWAHIDLAGPAYSIKPVSQGQAGATGYGVALLTRWLTQVAEQGTRRSSQRTKSKAE